MARAQGKKSTGNNVENARRRAGRPPVGEELYDPKLCRKVIVAGSNGLSETELANQICEVSRSAMRAWAKKYPEFRDALQLANEASQAWWERKGRKAIDGKPFNHHVWNKVLTCRYRNDYNERITVEGDADKPLHSIHTIKRVIVRAEAK